MDRDRRHPTGRQATARRARRADSESYGTGIPERLMERAAHDVSRLQPREVLRLQRAIGNRALGQLLAEREVPPKEASEPAPSSSQLANGASGSSFTLEAVIPCSGSAARTRAAAPLAAPVPSTADSAKGESEPVVTKEAPGEMTEEEADAIAPTLVYSGTVGARATPPSASQFGVTTTNVKMTGVRVDQVTPGAALAPGVVTGNVAKLISAFSGSGPPPVPTVAAPPAANHFKVTAGVDVTAKWAVHGLGRTDVTSADSAAITGDNYTRAASDLTPNMASDGGRPPRTQFWASDLTSIHEQFHANERTGTYGRAAFELARGWLAAQTADTADQARALVDQVPAKMFESYNASFTPGKELRAYGDGAPVYRARADAISARATEFAIESIGNLLFGGGD